MSQESNTESKKTGLLSRVASKTDVPVAKTLADSPKQTSRVTATTTRREEMLEAIKDEVRQRTLAETDIGKKKLSPGQVRDILEGIYAEVLGSANYQVSRRDRADLFEAIFEDLVGFGPLEKLLSDDETTDIMVLNHEKVYVERGGRLYKTDIAFDDEEHLMRIIQRIVSPLGRRIDEASPMVDARMPDGSRVNAVIRPIAIDGPSLTIRKFSAVPLSVEQLIEYGTVTEAVIQFLSACVLSGANIIVAGGSSSGKTTLLNVLSGYIPEDERVITIENAAELRLRQPHVVRLESRPANIEGEGQMTIRDLVINSLRMRPDRIVVGEVRSGEALDMLQAMNTGHDGSMGTIHSNTAADALARLEVMCLMSGMDLPVQAIREQIASAVDVVVQMKRLRDGTRKIVAIAEVVGMEGDTVSLSDLFSWDQSGIDAEGFMLGNLGPTGIEPQRMVGRLESAGILLPPDMFFNPRMQRILASSSSSSSAFQAEREEGTTDAEAVHEEDPDTVETYVEADTTDTGSSDESYPEDTVTDYD